MCVINTNVLIRYIDNDEKLLNTIINVVVAVKSLGLVANEQLTLEQVERRKIADDIRIMVASIIMYKVVPDSLVDVILNSFVEDVNWLDVSRHYINKYDEGTQRSVSYE